MAVTDAFISGKLRQNFMIENVQVNIAVTKNNTTSKPMSNVTNNTKCLRSPTYGPTS